MPPFSNWIYYCQERWLYFTIFLPERLRHRKLLLTLTSFEVETCPVFRVNDFSALMLTLGAADFSRRTKVLRFRPKPTSTKRHELYHTSRPRKTPTENRQGPSINPPTTNYGWGLVLPFLIFIIERLAVFPPRPLSARPSWPCADGPTPSDAQTAAAPPPSRPCCRR